MSYKNSHTLPWLQRMQTVLLMALVSFFGAAAVEPPSFDPGECEFYNPVTVSISSAEGTTVRYTTDGTEPTEIYGTVYTNPLTLSRTTTINAVAIDASGNISDVVSATYRCTRFGMGEDFDPENPGDPEGVIKYNFKVMGDPVGDFNYSNNGNYRIVPGDPVNVTSYGVDGYVFDGFYLENKLVSDTTTYSFIMPEHNVLLVGKYRFDPNSPQNPETVPFTRKLIIRSEPEGVGDFNTGNRDIAQGETFDIWAYDRDGFVFDYFTVDGVKTPCTNPEDHRIELTMGTKNIEVVAYYHFDPVSPAEPSANYWDAQTGTLDIDYFRPGNLYDAIRIKLEQNRTNWDMVTKVTVRGEMDNNDFGVLRDMPNIGIIDVSHTAGMTYVPSWALEWSPVSTILLPPTIDVIEYCAFYGCNNLSSLSIYAAMPPYAEDNIFYNIDDVFNVCVLHVPEASIPLYREHELWGRFLNIEPILDDIHSITLQFPESLANQYRNFTLELTNTLTASRQRYVIGSRTNYIFAGVLDNDPYRLTLSTPGGYEIARISDLVLNGEDMVVSFKSITPVYDPTVIVTLPDDKDVTDKVTAEWYLVNKEGSIEPYTFIGRNATITNIPEGYQLQCRLTLNEELGREYSIPENVDMTVAKGQTITKVVLSPLRQITLSGNVIDSEGNPLENAYVTVHQEVNGLYSKTSSTSTDAQGHWEITVVEAPSTTVTIAAPEFVSVSQSLTGAALTEDQVDLGTTKLKIVGGAHITYNITYTEAVVSGKSPVKQTYNDYLNVEISVYNLTQDRQQENISVQYPQIVVLDENVNAGDKLLITASSKNGKFAPMDKDVTIDDDLEASVVFSVMGPGGIKPTYESVSPDANTQRVVAMVYNSNGELVSKAEYKDFEAEFLNLEDDTYTVVTMLKTSRLNSIARLVALEETGLRQGTDYLQKQVNVTKGVIAELAFGEVPALDESKFNHTANSTALTINKTSLTTGQYATIKALVLFKEAYADGISDVKIILDLPQGCQVVEKSAMLGSSFIPFSEEDNTVVFALGQSYTDYLKMCVMPTVGGLKNISAYVEFEYDGQTYRETIGNVSFNAKDLAITVPPVTVKETLYVAGIAKGGAHINIYDDNTLIGQSGAIASGSWVAECQLLNPAEGSTHNIYATITNADGTTLTTETKACKYDPNGEVPEMVEMVLYNGWLRHNVNVHFNYEKAIIEENSYMFYERTDISFIATFANPEKVKNVVIHVMTSSNDIRHLPAIYNPNKKIWVSTSTFDSESLPTNTSVTYDIIEGEDVIVTVEFNDNSGEFFPVPTNPILDPSGFVYEGDEDNRLEEVQCSLYLKEEVEDMYGDKQNVISLWNAEEYGQKNPLFTDALGMYRWDVVDGLWQVKFEKSGYNTTYSEWMKVPPPQLEVNIGMERINAPLVSEIHAYEDGIDIKFDQPMDPESLNAENIKVLVDNKYIIGNVEYTLNEGAKYVQSCRFVPEDPFEVNKVYLVVGRHVASHSGIEMNTNMGMELDIELEIKAINAAQTAEVGYEAITTLNVEVTPAAASAGKTLRVATSSDMIVSLESETALIDNEGNATVTITGELPGSAHLFYTIDDIDLEAYTKIDVVSSLSEIVAPKTIDGLIDTPIKTSIYALPANVAAGQTVNITISDPEGLSLSCGTTLTLDDDGYGTFTINPTKSGEYTINYSITTDKGVLKASSKPSIKDYMIGDANGDRNITVADITVMVQYILGNNPRSFVFAAADINRDKDVTVSDITRLIKLIMYPSSSPTANMSRVASKTDARYTISSVDFDEAGYCVAEVSFNKATEAVGTQFDMILPQGMKVEDIQLAGANSRYSMAYSYVGDNRVRVLAYTLSGKHFAEDVLFDVILSGESTSETDAQLVITNALYDTISEDNEVDERVASGCSVTLNDITGISTIEALEGVRVYTEGHTLVVESPIDTHMVLSNVLGQYRVLDVKAGLNRFHVAESGVIMVNNHKVIIK